MEPCFHAHLLSAAMSLVTLDIALLLPTPQRDLSMTCSKALANEMTADGYAAHFVLGTPFEPDVERSDICEPHVSIFMLCVEESEVHDVVESTRKLSTSISAINAEASEYRHNPFGAPEVYFTKSQAWIELQHTVVKVIEPHRSGRLRKYGPEGDNLKDVTLNPMSDQSRVGQLLKYGYDEISDGADDRFNPHVTLTWPDNPNSRVNLNVLPEPSSFSTTLTELGVFGMSPYGTCTTNYGQFALAQ